MSKPGFDGPLIRLSDRCWKGLAEEQPDAYKDVNMVVNVVIEPACRRKLRE